MAAGGITFDAFYPYSELPSQCDLTKNEYPITVRDWYYIRDESAMINHVLTKGPLAVSLDASRFEFYKSGIYTDCSTPITINHAVQIVGVNVEEGYWIIRNSWGSDWGDNGYMKLALVCVCVVTPACLEASALYFTLLYFTLHV